MKTLLLVLALGLCMVSAFREAPSMPLIAWSSNQLFSQHNEQLLQTITEEDIQNTLQAILLKNGMKSFLTINGAAETVVMFVEPQLHTEDMSRFGAAYTTHNGGAFSTLKSLIENSASSAVAPYVASGFSTSFMDSILARVAGKMTRGSIVLVQDEGAPLLRALSEKSNVETISMNKLKETIENEVPDMIVVCLSSAANKEDFTAHDATVGKVTQMVSTATNGNFIGMYTGNSVTSTIVREFSDPSAEYVTYNYYSVQENYGAGNKSNSTEPRTYFTGPMLETFMVCLALIVMVFVGICNLCSLQTPEAYETPKREVQKMM